MSEALAGLYRAVILDHSKRPRNVGRLARVTHSADGDNPLCGDSIHVDLELEGETVRDVGFEGSGCVISTASASLMTEHVKGRTREEARVLLQAMETLCRGQSLEGTGTARELGDLAAFQGVRHYPLRVRCATLPWQTMGRALRI